MLADIINKMVLNLSILFIDVINFSANIGKYELKNNISVKKVFVKAVLAYFSSIQAHNKVFINLFS